MRKQVIQKKVEPKRAIIIDERKPVPAPPDVACRTVLYVEAGALNTAQLQDLCARVSEMYLNNRGGIHYILPVRNGKIAADIFFEEEWLRVVRDMCEVNSNGEIVLKNDAAEIQVTREFIS